ncbi:MAG: CpsD/CapB family tyrosine-protein kinase [Gammaproteobacteria bacterium]
MERIQRALELARLQRGPQSENDVARAERATIREEFPQSLVPVARLPVDRATLRERRIVFSDDVGPAASAYRMLRTQVLQRARTHGLTAIGVISAINGEGKTLTAINLAMSLAAEPNQSVLLMDLDLRRPTVASTLGLNVERGLETWFAQGGAPEKFCYGLEGVERLLILPTLTPVVGSSEALANVGTRKLLGELKTRDPGQLLIIDLPPVLLSDDVLTMAPLLDGVVLVAAEGGTRREDIVRVLELLASTRVLGTVLNRSSESEQRTY